MRLPYHKTIITVCLTGYIVGMGFLINSCVVGPRFAQRGNNCVARAKYNISIAEVQGFNTRLAYGFVRDSLNTHVQAQAYINGKWEFVEAVGNNIIEVPRDLMFAENMSHLSSQSIVDGILKR